MAKKKGIVITRNPITKLVEKNAGIQVTMDDNSTSRTVTITFTLKKSKKFPTDIPLTEFDDNGNTTPDKVYIPLMDDSKRTKGLQNFTVTADQPTPNDAVKFNLAFDVIAAKVGGSGV
ncbi:MAG: hypothetical protein ABI861_02180 [Panacibacter sp.]